MKYPQANNYLIYEQTCENTCRITDYSQGEPVVWETDIDTAHFLRRMDGRTSPTKYLAVLPWCREKEVLWVFVFTVLVWLVTDLRFVWEYRELFLESGSRVKNLIFRGYFTIMLVCAQVIGFNVIAGMIWKKQRYEYGTNEGEEDD